MHGGFRVAMKEATRAGLATVGWWGFFGRLGHGFWAANMEATR